MVLVAKAQSQTRLVGELVREAVGFLKGEET
jgi:hypothetical protein